MTTITTNRTTAIPTLEAATSTAQVLRLHLGPFHVAVRCVMADALEDMQYLYRNCMVDRFDTTAQVIDIRVVRRPGRSLLAKRYNIYGDGEELFIDRRSDEVLPYIEWAINWRIIASQHRFLQLHAGTVSHHGKGVILSGKSGSGKSTLTAGLLTHGWKYFSDEFALIDPRTFQLHPYPKALCVKHGSFDVIKKLGLPLWNRRHYVKSFKGRVAYVSPADINRDVVAKPCGIDYIILPQHTGTSKPMLTEIPRAEAVIELAKHNFNRNDFGGLSIEMLSHIVRHAQCYRFETGDIDTSCAALESVVGS